MHNEIRKETTAEGIKNFILGKKKLYTFQHISKRTNIENGHLCRVLNGELSLTPKLKEKLIRYLESECDYVR